MMKFKRDQLITPVETNRFWDGTKLYKVSEVISCGDRAHIDPCFGPKTYLNSSGYSSASQDWIEIYL